MDLFLLIFSICDHWMGDGCLFDVKVTWLEERLRDFSIMNLVKVVNVRVPTA